MEQISLNEALDIFKSNFPNFVLCCHVDYYTARRKDGSGVAAVRRTSKDLNAADIMNLIHKLNGEKKDLPI